MAAGTLPVQSDPTLLADIRRYGKFDPTGCYQCGSCTISCDLVEGSVSFPRRSIRFALLGLRQPLVGSLEPWVCHDCGDCSIVCPRQSEPRISMLTLRRFLSSQYEWTGMASKLLTSRAWYFGSLGFVAVLVVLLILCYHLWYVGLPFSGLATPLGMEHMFPIMTYYTLTVMLFPLLLLLSRVHRVWLLTMRGEQQPPIPFSVYVEEAWMYVYQSATHSLRWFQTDNIYPLYNPQRWLGYVAAAFIFYGVGDILIGRVQAKKEIYKETRPEDLVFPVLLLLTAFSGFSVNFFRYAGFALCAHFAYALHVIIATPMLVVEMPFGKAAHMVYRPLALYFLAVRERAARQAPAAEVVPHAV